MKAACVRMFALVTEFEHLREFKSTIQVDIRKCALFYYQEFIHVNTSNGESHIILPHY